MARSNVYKTLPALTNLYRTLRAPLLKSNHCTQPIEMIAAIDLTAHRGASMNRKKLTATLVKAIVAAFTASGILAIGTQTASAQQIIVTVPFAFSAGDQLYPSGTYQFTLLSAWSLSMRNMNGGGERFFMVSPKQNGPKESHAAIVFRNSTGHKDLEAVHVPGSDISAELLTQDHVSPKPRSPEQNATLR
jgi:hypothetical protein